MPPETIKNLFSFISLCSYCSAFVLGVFYWKRLVGGTRIIVVLTALSVGIDVYGLYLTQTKQYASAMWLDFNDLLNVILVIVAVMRLGRDVLMDGVTRFLWVVLVGYTVTWLAVWLFVPEWFQSRYFAPLSYLLLALVVGVVLVEYYRFNALHFSGSEVWIYFALLFYYSGVVLLLLVKIGVRDLEPSLFWLPHTLLAVVKNGMFIRAYILESKKWKRSTSLVVQ